MRTAVILALLTCGSCSGAGHDSGSGAHVRGLRSGPWTEYFQNGNKQSEGRYENDVQTGLWTYWFENGSKEMEGRFEDERREGPWTAWHDNGALRAEGRFEAGFEEGTWRFHDRSGALEHVGTFELGQPALRWTWFRPDGTVRETGVYRAGVKIGSWTAQDAAGNWTETNYPIPAGCEWVEERFGDSTQKRTGFLRDGVPAGRWNSFHPGRKLRLECSFDHGVPDGSARAWREDGSLLACGRLKDGCILGKWVFTRDGAQEERAAGDPRPRQPFSGEWSPASSAELPGWLAVETWVAEICSPRQPAPIPPVVASPSAATAPSPAAEDVSGIPARAQPWTEYERRVLPQLVELYGRGRSARDDEYQGRPVLRTNRSGPAPAVAQPAELIGRPLPLRRFTTAQGAAIDLDEFRGKRNVLVTILRGFGGQVCVYCTAQTKALAGYADKFAALDTQVVVVFPGPASGMQAFLEAYRRTFGEGAKPPYELLYDADLGLTRALHIEDDIAVPTSILLDRQGIVRWCRVAKDHADRPSAQEVLDRIAALPKREP
jgi:antitoxin component YwqK of YwqJK toxin-antitoxin module/peroxiredoxin